VTAVFPKQGICANDAQALATNPPADVAITSVGEFLECDLQTLFDCRC
jgi:hypothetical protein